jgi:hypothetical protein
VRSLLLLALLLLAIKKLGESVLALCCFVLLGYGVFALIRRNPTGLLRGATSYRRA